MTNAWLVTFAGGACAARLIDFLKLRWRPVRGVVVVCAIGFPLLFVFVMTCLIEALASTSVSSQVVVPELFGAVGVAWVTHELCGFLQTGKDRNRVQVRSMSRRR